MQSREPCKKTMTFTPTCLLILTLSAPTFASNVYHCNTNGAINYSDTPCSTNKHQKGDPTKPHWYMNIAIEFVATAFNTHVNQGGAVVFEDDFYIANFSSNSQGVVSFAQVQLKNYTCNQAKPTPYNELTQHFKTFDINAHSLTPILGLAHYTSAFHDHEKHLKVSFTCPYNGAFLTASFSQKYYQAAR